MLDDIFRSEKTYTAVIQEPVQTVTSGQLSAITWTTVSSVECLFWHGGISKNLVNEKIKGEVEATIALKPSDIAVQSIPKNGRIIIQDSAFGATVNNVAGYTTGSTTMAIDGFNDYASPITKYDKFTAAGETGSPEHIISDTTTSSGITVNLYFSPGLASDIADDTVLSIIPIKGTYSIIYPDDIALQNQLIIILLKEFR